MRILRSVPTLAEEPIALTIGNFDGVHLGHRAMVARLREMARPERLPVCAMTFEPQPREFFAPDQAPPRLTPLSRKLELLRDAGVERTYVRRFDYRFAQTSADDFIERILVRGLGVRRLLVGDDFRFGRRRAGDFALLREKAERFGYTVESMGSVLIDGERVSSTAVRNALASGEVEQARGLLGRPYAMTGCVVRGDGLGRQLGFPTANVRIKQTLPAVMGIFAVEVAGVGATPLRGVASVGVRPTVKQQARPVLEVYVLDFSGDLYGKRVRVDFLHKFRDEEKFADLATLTHQIAVDVAHARGYFEALDAATRTA